MSIQCGGKMTCRIRKRALHDAVRRCDEATIGRGLWRKQGIVATTNLRCAPYRRFEAL
jgi:hypothetical protein